MSERSESMRQLGAAQRRRRSRSHGAPPRANRRGAHHCGSVNDRDGPRGRRQPRPPRLYPQAVPVDQLLVDAAVELIERRLPTAPWATAAAVYLDDGSILTGICLDNFNSAAGLCAEAGPICTAYTGNRQITASVCVTRAADRPGDLVLAPCGLSRSASPCGDPTSRWASVTPGPPPAGRGGGWPSSTPTTGRPPSSTTTGGRPPPNTPHKPLI